MHISSLSYIAHIKLSRSKQEEQEKKVELVEMKSGRNSRKIRGNWWVGFHFMEIRLRQLQSFSLPSKRSHLTNWKVSRASSSFSWEKGVSLTRGHSFQVLQLETKVHWQRWHLSSFDTCLDPHMGFFVVTSSPWTEVNLQWIWGAQSQTPSSVSLTLALVWALGALFLSSQAPPVMWIGSLPSP